MKALIYGVGVNDADYVTQPTINGKIISCPAYAAWKRVMERCYSKKHMLKRPTYAGCEVCQEWIYFMNFRSWFFKQDWQGKALDKDIICEGNRIYSPETCAFVDAATNNFTVDRASKRGDWPLGVTFHKAKGKLKAQCQNPFTRKNDYLGMFLCPNQAYEAWRKHKHQLALKLADLQTDQRVAAALRVRYLPKEQ